jgi:hypothetical protein
MLFQAALGGIFLDPSVYNSDFEGELTLNKKAARAFLSLRWPFKRETKMKKAFLIAGIFSLVTALHPFEASAQGKSGLKGLDRADQAAGPHGKRGRAIARKHGANKTGFCPPGQRKKAGAGSRFKC